jgi:aryl-alcohol dehydrogenase-like predicted oxidoreductase
MQYRKLGTTGIRISTVSFGAGPVPALMTAESPLDLQQSVIAHALEAGINWFDTAATYGAGQSERSLGRALGALGHPPVHVATKVRVPRELLDDIAAFVRESVDASLSRLGLPRVTLIQLHNSITASRGDLPTSITPDDVLGPGGVLEGLERVRLEGKTTLLGLTGIGDVSALIDVARSRAFATLQAPYHVLNPSAGDVESPDFTEARYGNIIAECDRLGMGVLAIRVFAGGALAGAPPSAHTQTTPFFPLAVYERDRELAARLEQEMPAELALPPRELAVRFVLSHAGVASALIGFSEANQIDEAIRAAEKGALPLETGLWLRRWRIQARSPVANRDVPPND